MKPSYLMEYNSGGAKPLTLIKCKINLINVATRPGHIVLLLNCIYLKYTLEVYTTFIQVKYMNCMKKYAEHTRIYKGVDLKDKKP